MLKTTRTKWLFTPSKADKQIVEQERQRLAALNPPGVTITRADVIRSLFARAAATEPSESYAEERRLKVA